MSSRALRKAQRELEEKKQQEILAAEHAAEESEEEDDNDHVVSRVPQKPSAFALLGEDEDEGDEDGDVKAELEALHDDAPSSDEAARPAITKSSKKKKKKKNKKRDTADQTATPVKPAQDSSLDEIDLALRALSTKASDAKSDSQPAQVSTVTPEQTELCKLVSIDTQNLHAENEMRKLFGRAALTGDDDDDAPAGNRRRNQQQVGIGAAVAGRNAPGQRNLASLGLRRNIFIQGKEDWPRATLGGLGMEVVSKNPDGTIEYRFVHNKTYQDVQRQFQECVASMDPQRMVQLLQFNPFHISTLLQVSEIATHERDRATSGSLLERALFSFGRAVHSTFASSLQSGKARLSFRRPENREFFLAAWRYITILGQRSTWRTAFEWALLLLSLDPDSDPYRISLVIDQFAIRGRQQAKLISLWNHPHFHSRWHALPNIATTIALAYAQTNEPSLARSFLKDAIEQFPHVAAAMYQALDIGSPPGGIWGSQPRTPAEELYTALYIHSAKDIWNTPAATSLLAEVASAIPSTNPHPPAEDEVKDIHTARHILLTDSPPLIALLPRSLTVQVTSTSDPLPPPDNLPSYTIAPSQPQRRTFGSAPEMLGEISTIRDFFRSFLPFFPARDDEVPHDATDPTDPPNTDAMDPDAPPNPANPAATHPAGGMIDPATGLPPTPEEIQRRIQEAGIDPEVVFRQSARLQELQFALEREIGREMGREGRDEREGGDARDR